MRIIILGSTGYLGRKMTDRLTQDGHEILALKRSGPDANMDDLESLLAQEGGYDCLLNFVCCYPRNASSDREIFKANLDVPLDVFCRCLNHGVRYYMTMGTGLPDDFNAYTASKAVFAHILRWYAKNRAQSENPIYVSQILLENFYGEDEPEDRFLPGVLASLKKNEKVLLTLGDQRRDFIYIDDVVDCLSFRLAIKDWPVYEDLPLGSGEGVTIRRAVEYLKEITGSASELCFGAIPKRNREPDSVADLTRMKEYGMAVCYDWKRGLKRFAEGKR